MATSKKGSPAQHFDADIDVDLQEENPGTSFGTFFLLSFE
jgi:hypothetical protein